VVLFPTDPGADGTAWIPVVLAINMVGRRVKEKRSGGQVSAGAEGDMRGAIDWGREGESR